MGARGRRGLLAGLESLAASINNISERNRKRLHDALAEEESRQRNERTKRDQEASDRADRELSAELARLAEDRKQREGLALAIQDLPGATEERELLHPLIRTSTRRVPLGNSIVREPTPTTRSLMAAIRADKTPSLSEMAGLLKPPKQDRSETDLEFYMRDPEAHRKYHESRSVFRPSAGRSVTQKPTLFDKAMAAQADRKKYVGTLLPERLGSSIGSEIAPSSRLGQLSSLDEIAAGAKPAQEKALAGEFDRYTRLRDEPEADMLESLSQAEWDQIAKAAVMDAVGATDPTDPVFIEATRLPHASIIKFAEPGQRKWALANIPRLFARPAND